MLVCAGLHYLPDSASFCTRRLLLHLAHQARRRNDGHGELHLCIIQFLSAPIDQALPLLLSDLDHDVEDLLQVRAILRRLLVLDVLLDGREVPLPDDEGDVEE